MELDNWAEVDMIEGVIKSIYAGGVCDLNILKMGRLYVCGFNVITEDDDKRSTIDLFGDTRKTTGCISWYASLVSDIEHGKYTDEELKMAKEFVEQVFVKGRRVDD